MSKRREEAALSSAWLIHQAQLEWTGRVDAKASFSFGIQSAIIAAAVTLVASDRVFDDFAGWQATIFVVGVALLGLGAVVAAVVVAPYLRRKNLQAESSIDHIYFGHIKHLNPKELERRLRRGDLLPTLSRQIVRTAKIAWKKHIRVQYSIWLGVLGGIALVLCALSFAV